MEGYINFKKPQNEMFKKLDGKIQKIVAAHSNLNKLYALNDFSSLGVGPKRPFELPPQLPPPPPWVPKGVNEFGNHWNEDEIMNNSPNNLTETSKLDMDCNNLSSNSGLLLIEASKGIKEMKNKLNSPGTANNSRNKSPGLTIDSAISKLHQRRQQQQQQQQQLTTKRSPSVAILTNQPVRAIAPSSSSSATATIINSSNKQQSIPTITPAQFSLLAKKIKETLETECGTKSQGGNLSPEDKKRFQENLIALLKEEITQVTKTAKFKFSSPPPLSKPKHIEQKSLLLKSSPQTLFNTIRRETSLLLNKRVQGNRSSLSLLSEQQTFNRQSTQKNSNSNFQQRQPLPPQFNKLQQTIKVIVHPTEYKCNLEQLERENSELQANTLHDKSSPLTYQVIKNKIRLFQEANHIYLGKASKSSFGITGSGFKRKSQKSLDNIVDRLQAKCSPSPTNEADTPQTSIEAQRASFQQQIINSSASLLQNSRSLTTISTPTPIPVFRSYVAASAKGAYFYGSGGTSRVGNMKTKQSKRVHRFGLKLGNYIERECPQPTNEKITIEQFAKCLNLVRTNDISLQRYHHQLSQSESKCRMPISNRPLRLRRLKGERLYMPPSASYKATRKVGLQ